MGSAVPIQQRQNAIQQGKAVGRNALERYPLQYGREKWDSVLLGLSEKLLGKNQQLTKSNVIVSLFCNCFKDRGNSKLTIRNMGLNASYNWGFTCNLTVYLKKINGKVILPSKLGRRYRIPGIH